MCDPLQASLETLAKTLNGESKYAGICVCVCVCVCDGWLTGELATIIIFCFVIHFFSDEMRTDVVLYWLLHFTASLSPSVPPFTFPPLFTCSPRPRTIT